MPYDHNRKVANLGDIWKHYCLAEAVAHRATAHKVGTEFKYLDTHAGAGVYQLASKGEWIRSARALRAVLPDTSNGFLSSLGDGLKERNRYLGSWALVAKIATDSGLLANVRAYETNTEVVQEARLNWSVLEREGTVKGLAKIAEENGFDAPEVRNSSGQQLSRAFDLVFVDPPYLGGGDWSEVAEFGKHLIAINRPFLIWYPFFWPTKPDVLVSRLGLISYEMHWAECGPRPSQNFKGCGVVPGGDLAGLFWGLTKKLGAFCCNLGFRLVTRTPHRPIN